MLTFPGKTQKRGGGGGHNQFMSYYRAWKTGSVEFEVQQCGVYDYCRCLNCHHLNDGKL